MKYKAGVDIGSSLTKIVWDRSVNLPERYHVRKSAEWDFSFASGFDADAILEALKGKVSKLYVSGIRSEAAVFLSLKLLGFFTTLSMM